MPNSSSQFRDYYGELGIGPDASDADIRTAWRKVAKRWHPDINRSPDAEEMMKRINVARDVLSDARRRAEYDATYRQQQSGGTGGTGQEDSHGKREEEGEARRQREAHEQARRESQRDQERRDRDSRQGHWSEARDRDAGRPDEFYLAAWRRTFDFRGMSTRTEFWSFSLINAAVALFLSLSRATAAGTLSIALDLAYTASIMLAFIPWLSVTTRRVRDATGSGLWTLFLLLPFVGGLVVLVMTLMPSKQQ